MYNYTTLYHTVPHYTTLNKLKHTKTHTKTHTIHTIPYYTKLYQTIPHYTTLYHTLYKVKHTLNAHYTL